MSLQVCVSISNVTAKINPLEEMATSPLRQEGIAFRNAYLDCGFSFPFGVTADAMRAAVAAPFIPGESHSLSQLSGLTPPARAYLDAVVQPTLEIGISERSPEVLELGRRVGRYLGAVFEAGGLNVDPPLNICPQVIHVDSEQAAINFSAGRVVEIGMGVNGFVSHVENVKKGRYRVAAISNHIGEVALLDGMASYFGVADDIINDEGGIGPCLRALLGTRSDFAAATDLVVASRVWTDDPAFNKGFAKVSQLLRPDGIVIARGNALSEEGKTGYDEVAQTLGRNRRLRLEIDRIYDRPLPYGRSAKQRLIVARRTDR